MVKFCEGKKPSIVFDNIANKLKAILTTTSNTCVIEMDAVSGDPGDGSWDYADSLPAGEYRIVENPTGNRNYFGLFFLDSNVNDQFLDGGTWRDGIRLGFNDFLGSHGCIITRQSSESDYGAAAIRWKLLQESIRSGHCKFYF